VTKFISLLPEAFIFYIILVEMLYIKKKINKISINKKKNKKRKTNKKQIHKGSGIPTIAIFYSGRIKGFQHKKNSHIKQNKLYKPIIFLSLNQKEEDDISKEFRNTFNIPDDRVNYEETKTPKEIFNFTKRNETSYENCYSQFYHNKKCLELIEKYQKDNNMIFDVIIKQRCDIDTNDIIPIGIPEDNTIYIPEGEDHLGINDRVAYGNYNSMKKYCDTVNNIIDMCKNQDIIYNPEIILKKQLENNKLNLIRFKYETNKFIANRK